MKRKVFVLIVFLLLFGSGFYFFFENRKENIVREKSTNCYLIFDNPSVKGLRVYLEKDSFEMAAGTTVYFPVNDKRISSGKVHIRSADLTTGKIIVDSTCRINEDVLHYFVNPSMSSYIRYSQMVMKLAGYEVDREFHKIGPRQIFTQNMGGADTTRLSNLVIYSKGVSRPFDDLPPKEESGTSHSETLIYLIDANRDSTVRQGKHIFYTENWKGFFFPEPVITLQ